MQNLGMVALMKENHTSFQSHEGEEIMIEV